MDDFEVPPSWCGLCSSSGISICTFVLVKQVNWVVNDIWMLLKYPPQLILPLSLSVTRSSGVSICSFVLVKQVNWVVKPELRWHALILEQPKGNQVYDASICNVVLVKQVNGVVKPLSWPELRWHALVLEPPAGSWVLLYQWSKYFCTSKASKLSTWAQVTHTRLGTTRGKSGIWCLLWGGRTPRTKPCFVFVSEQKSEE